MVYLESAPLGGEDMTAPLDDAAVTALVGRLRMYGAYYDVRTDAANALERLAADLAALRRRLDALVQDPAVEDRETQWVMLRAELAAARAELRAYARLVDKDDAAEMQVIDWAADEKRVEDLYNRVQMAESTAWRLTQVAAERDAARAEWQRLYDLAAQYRAERDAARAEAPRIASDDDERCAYVDYAENQCTYRDGHDRHRTVSKGGGVAMSVPLWEDLAETYRERDDLRTQVAAVRERAKTAEAELFSAKVLLEITAKAMTERNAQVAAVRALCEDPRPPESVHVPADMILAALDTAGQTEGESCDKPGPHAAHDGCEGVPWPEASALPSGQDVADGLAP